MDVAAKKFTKLGDSEYQGNYLWPMYGHNEIFFVSDRLPNEKSLKWGGPEAMKSVNNIWKISDRGGAPVQVTHHTSGNLFFPSISADGKTIVYEENFGLWKLDTASGKSTQVAVDIKSDLKENEVEVRTLQNEADGFSLSPSSRRAAVSSGISTETASRPPLVAEWQVDRVCLRSHWPPRGLGRRRTRPQRQTS